MLNVLFLVSYFVFESTLHFGRLSMLVLLCLWAVAHKMLVQCWALDGKIKCPPTTQPHHCTEWYN